MTLDNGSGYVMYCAMQPCNRLTGAGCHTCRCLHYFRSRAQTLEPHCLIPVCELQATGFLACFVLFLLPACIYGALTGSASGIKAFQFIYFFSSFWNQFGPNCTTFLVAGMTLPLHALHAVTKYGVAPVCFACCVAGMTLPSHALHAVMWW